MRRKLIDISRALTPASLVMKYNNAPIYLVKANEETFMEEGEK
jgi:hypothetical protein